MSAHRILVVEDDQVARMVLAKGLRLSGYEVLEAATGEDALEICARETVDLAILDYKLPEMSGLELASHCRNVYDIPFFFLSVMQDQEIAAKAIEEGAYGYLVKPPRMSELLPQIEAALKHAAAATRLSRAATETQLVNIALGILMARHGLKRAQAFAKLRRICRPRKQTAQEAAERIVTAFEAGVDAEAEHGRAENEGRLSEGRKDEEDQARKEPREA